MYTAKMFDMWSNVTSKFEGHTSLQTNVQTNGGQTQSSGSIKGKYTPLHPSNTYEHFFSFFLSGLNFNRVDDSCKNCDCDRFDYSFHSIEPSEVMGLLICFVLSREQPTQWNLLPRAHGYVKIERQHTMKCYANAFLSQASQFFGELFFELMSNLVCSSRVVFN